MSLTSFGSIFNFAEELEKQDMRFYTEAAAAPVCLDWKTLLEGFAKGCKKNVLTAQRTRRECVTEMILEPINGLVRGDFQVDVADVAEMSSADVLERAQALEERAERFYLTAAERIKAMPEAVQALKMMAKLRIKHRKVLEAR